MLSVPALAQNDGLKGRTFLSGYGGYSFGVSDPWGDQEAVVNTPIHTVVTTGSLDPSLSVGAMFHYGVSQKLMIGAEFGIQRYKTDEQGTIDGALYDRGSETKTRVNGFLNGLWALSYREGDGGFFVTGGAGFYGGLNGPLNWRQVVEDVLAGKDQDNDGAVFGVNGGLMYTHMVSENLAVFVMPRFHLVFSDPTAKMVQVVGGIQIPVGG